MQLIAFGKGNSGSPEHRLWHTLWEQAIHTTQQKAAIAHYSRKHPSAVQHMWLLYFRQLLPKLLVTLWNNLFWNPVSIARNIPKPFWHFGVATQGRLQFPLDSVPALLLCQYFHLVGLNGSTAVHSGLQRARSCHRNSIRVDHAGPKRTWLTSSGRGPKEQFLLQGGFLKLDASDEFFYQKKWATKDMPCARAFNGKDVPRAWNCHTQVKDSFPGRWVLGMHYFHVLWVSSCKAIWETTNFSTFVHVKPWMAATATLPSARRHWHQTAMHQTALLKTAKVRTALSPCERHADVSPFGWVIQKCLNGSTAVHSGLLQASCQRNSICVDHAGPKRTWRRQASNGRGPKEQFLLQGDSLNLDASDEFFITRNRLKKICHVLLQILYINRGWHCWHLDVGLTRVPGCKLRFRVHQMIWYWYRIQYK